MNNSLVAIEWVRQNKDEGHGSNFFFIGRKLYSYRMDYLLGVVHGSPPNLGILRPDHYSNSTAKHRSHALRALIQSGIKVICVPEMEALPEQHEANVNYLIEECEEEYRYLLRRKTHRTRQYSANRCRYLIGQTRKYLDYFNYNHPRAEAFFGLMKERLVEYPYE